MIRKLNYMCTLRRAFFEVVLERDLNQSGGRKIKGKRSKTVYLGTWVLIIKNLNRSIFFIFHTDYFNKNKFCRISTLSKVIKKQPQKKRV